MIDKNFVSPFLRQYDNNTSNSQDSPNLLDEEFNQGIEDGDDSHMQLPSLSSSPDNAVPNLTTDDSYIVRAGAENLNIAVNSDSDDEFENDVINGQAGLPKKAREPELAHDTTPNIKVMSNDYAFTPLDNYSSDDDVTGASKDDRVVIPQISGRDDWVGVASNDASSDLRTGLLNSPVNSKGEGSSDSVKFTPILQSDSSSPLAKERRNDPQPSPDKKTKNGSSKKERAKDAKEKKKAKREKKESKVSKDKEPKMRATPARIPEQALQEDTTLNTGRSVTRPKLRIGYNFSDRDGVTIPERIMFRPNDLSPFMETLRRYGYDSVREGWDTHEKMFWVSTVTLKDSDIQKIMDGRFPQEPEDSVYLPLEALIDEVHESHSVILAIFGSDARFSYLVETITESDGISQAGLIINSIPLSHGLPRRLTTYQVGEVFTPITISHSRLSALMSPREEGYSHAGIQLHQHIILGLFRGPGTQHVGPQELAQRRQNQLELEAERTRTARRGAKEGRERQFHESQSSLLALKRRKENEASERDVFTPFRDPVISGNYALVRSPIAIQFIGKGWLPVAIFPHCILYHKMETIIELGRYGENGGVCFFHTSSGHVEIRDNEDAGFYPVTVQDGHVRNPGVPVEFDETEESHSFSLDANATFLFSVSGDGGHKHSVELLESYERI